VSVAARLTYVALLIAAPLLPQLGHTSRTWWFPSASHFWVYLPFCGLFLLPLIDIGRLRRLLHLDLLVLLCFGIAIGTWRESSAVSMLCLYGPMAYLFARMVSVARVGRAASAAPTVTPTRSWLPGSWLLAGILVLAVVHANWTLGEQVGSDVGPASVEGAQKLLHGQPVYGVSRATLAHFGFDPHRDTYGPIVYEAYVPFASIAGAHLAARMAALFFDLLTAVLLFLLGRSVRGPTTGAMLAYGWLAFPLTLYTDGLAANDSIVAAALVATLLVARSPARRGAMGAVAVWTKLTPLALVPALISHAPAPRSRRAGMLTFAAAFLLASALALAPTLLHSSLSTFLTRTVGFQLSRPPGYSIWELLLYPAHHQAAWIRPTAQIARGLLIALTGTFAVALAWWPKRQDTVGLAGASAAVLIALQVCDGYFSFTYILWFAPLVLVALIVGRDEHAPTASTLDRVAVRERRDRQAMTVSALGRLVSTSGAPSPTTTRSSMRTPMTPGR
jgi:F0F1-type ATP synthase assembly protein I